MQLTYGLPFLFDLEKRQRYHQRRRLLLSKGLPRTPVALAAHLQRAVPDGRNRHRYLGDNTPRDIIPWTRVSARNILHNWSDDRDGVDGLDSAPFRLWLQAHSGLCTREIAYWPENLYLRKCGYVMWDIPLAGADDLNFDEEMCQWIRDGQRQALIETIERQRGQDQMRRSWKERAAIYEELGRGYWNTDGLHEI